MNCADEKYQLADAPANQLFTDWLVDCYLYYELCTQVRADHEFDDLYQELERRWHEVDHPHMHLADPAQLKSGYYISAYPTILKSVAQKILEGKMPRRYYVKADTLDLL